MAKRKLTDAERLEHSRVSALDYYHTTRRGMRPQPCEICGATPAECHHIDYSDPERRMWLCELHHKQTHSQFGKPAPLDWMADIRAAMARIDIVRVASRKGRAAAEKAEPIIQAARRRGLSKSSSLCILSQPARARSKRFQHLREQKSCCLPHLRRALKSISQTGQ